MKNDKLLLTKLIDETDKDIITWVSSDKPEGYGYKYNYVKWKGEKNITPNKHIAFVLNYYNYEWSDCELRIFLINDLLKTREPIYEIEPGIFSFKTKKLFEKLINKIIEKSKEPGMGPHVPPLKHVWDEEDSD